MQTSKLFNTEASTIKRVRDASVLIPINNLKLLFREIRDYFAGNVTGITRDEVIAQNIMRILFCKIYDERHNRKKLEFVNIVNEDSKATKGRIEMLFENVKDDFPGVFETEERIEVSADSLAYVVSKLQHYSVLDADRDVIGDAFEELIGTSFRGGEGQFFTPRNVVQMMIDTLNPQSGERILDPACGSGGFLAYTFRTLLENKRHGFAIFGVDKDAFLAKIARAYLSLLGEGDFNIFCENSLDQPKNWDKKAQSNLIPGSFDLILTNPPFGSKIPVIGEDLLAQYQLGHVWSKTDGLFPTEKLLDKQPPQILFIERCLQLLKDGGRMGIVLPEGIFGNPSDKYVWEYISSVAVITGVVSLAQETFQPSTHTKTSVLFLKKTSKRPKSVFMAIAENIGHNKNGKPIFKKDEKGNAILNDDLPSISSHFLEGPSSNKNKNNSHLGFFLPYEDLSDHIFIPEYYNPEIKSELTKLREDNDYDVYSVGDLLKDNVLEIRRGNEIGSQSYGTGEIPFVRTSDIVNWEIKFDPIKAVSEEVYAQYKETQDIAEGDILFVNDGTFLIGRTAMVTNLDVKMLIQSHLKKIRVLDKGFIDPHYLFYLMNSKVVRRQIDSKTFVQATISTIGNRLKEVLLPISKNQVEVRRISEKVKEIINTKAKLREQTIKLINQSI